MDNNYYFPIFINLKDKEIVVFGAGKIAYRRVYSLINTGACITIVSPTILDKFYDINYGKLKIIKDYYNKKYINSPFIVFAITNDNKTNDEIYDYCIKKNITINIANDKTKCDFFFPATIYENNYTIGICGNGNNHKYVKNIYEKIKRFLKVGDNSDSESRK